MRSVAILLALLFYIDSLSAQNIESLYECIYKYSVSSQDKNNNQYEDIGYCMLQI